MGRHTLLRAAAPACNALVALLLHGQPWPCPDPAAQVKLVGVMVIEGGQNVNTAGMIGIQLDLFANRAQESQERPHGRRLAGGGAGAGVI